VGLSLLATPTGIEADSEGTKHVLSSGYDACRVQIGAEKPNDSIPIGPAIGPETGTVGAFDKVSRAAADVVVGGDEKVAHNPRADLIAELSRRVEALALVGDTKALAVLTEALQRLVEAPDGARAPVFDLATERVAKRGKRGGQ
jgi:hypothetical protein